MNFKEILDLLNRRVARLNGLADSGAPTVIQATELKLIQDATTELLTMLGENK